MRSFFLPGVILFLRDLNAIWKEIGPWLVGHNRAMRLHVRLMLWTDRIEWTL